MSQNKASEAGIHKYTAGADISSGDVVDLGGRVGIALVDIANGDTGSVAIDGIWTLAKSTDTITQGQVLYWDTGNSRVDTAQATGFPRLGIAAEGAATGDSYVDVEINVPETAGRDSCASGDGTGAGNAAAIERIVQILEKAGLVEKL